MNNNALFQTVFLVILLPGMPYILFNSRVALEKLLYINVYLIW